MDDIGPKKIKDSYQFLVQTDGTQLTTADDKTTLFNNINLINTAVSSYMTPKTFIIDNRSEFDNITKCIESHYDEILEAISNKRCYIDIIYDITDTKIFSSLVSDSTSDFSKTVYNFINLYIHVVNESTMDVVFLNKEYKLHFMIDIQDGKDYTWSNMPYINLNDKKQNLIGTFELKSGMIYDCEIIFRLDANTNVVTIHYNLTPTIART